MDEEGPPPQQCPSYPFAPMTGHPQAWLSRTQGDWSSASTVELMSDIYACVVDPPPVIRSPEQTDQISLSVAKAKEPVKISLDVAKANEPVKISLDVVKANEPVTPLPTIARRARAARRAPQVKLRDLRPASTRIRKPPLRVSEAANTAVQQPRRSTTKTGGRRSAKRSNIAPAPALTQAPAPAPTPAPAAAPAPVVEASTLTWEQEQEQEEFMQLLRDTIESNRNAGYYRRTSLPLEDPDAEDTHRADREQTVDADSDYTPPPAIKTSRLRGVSEGPTPAFQIDTSSPVSPCPMNNAVVAPAPHRPVLGLFR